MASLWLRRGRVLLAVVVLTGGLLAAWPGGTRAASAAAAAGSQVWTSRYAAGDPGVGTVMTTAADGNTVCGHGNAGVGEPLRQR